MLSLRHIFIYSGAALILVHSLLFVPWLHNELDTLLIAKNWADSSFLENDWYLSLSAPYRIPFNALVGWSLQFLNFSEAVVVWRALFLLFFFVCFYRLFKALNILPILLIPILSVFLLHQSLGAGEWVVGGIETKVLSYGFSFLALGSSILENRQKMFLYLGLALLFHVLVGIFMTFCLLFTELFSDLKKKSSLKDLLHHSRFFFIFGSIGIFLAASQFFSVVSGNSQLADWVSVHIRLPHHLNPMFMNPKFLDYFIVVFFAQLAIYLLGRHFQIQRIQKISLFSFMLSILFIVGWLSSTFELDVFIKYYWFRLPDTFLPLILLLSIGMAISFFIRKTAIPIRHCCFLVLILICLFVVGKSTRSALLKKPHFPLNFLKVPQDIHSALTWIQKNTPDTIKVLHDPGFFFYPWIAERESFVSIKHYPQSSDGIEEWFRRITLIAPKLKSDAPISATSQYVSRKFYSLPEDRVRDISRLYGFDFYLGLSKRPLPFKKIYSNPTLSLYDLRMISKQGRTQLND